MLFLLIKPKSNNSLLLTEDKKAIKKSSQPKNKVRFQLDNDPKIFRSPSSSSIKTAKTNKFHTYENQNDLKIEKTTSCTKPKGDELNIELVKSINNHLKPSCGMSNPMMSNSTPSISSTNSNLQQNQTSILKVYLENRAIKSFKYDRNTCVKEVLSCLKDKLSINNIEYFGLVLKPSNQQSISKFILLHEMQHLYEINETYLRNAGYDDDTIDSSCSSDDENSDELADADVEDYNCNEKRIEGDDDKPPLRKLAAAAAVANEKQRKRRLRKPISYVCLFRFVFVPSDFQELNRTDENAFNYLYEQVINSNFN